MITPIIPQYISFRDFADRFHEDYIEAHLPIMYDEKEWFKWAAAISGNEYFAKFSIPGASEIKDGQLVASYKTWQEWAERLYICITNNIYNEN
jgi:hypothetical protein